MTVKGSNEALEETGSRAEQSNGVKLLADFKKGKVSRTKGNGYDPSSHSLACSHSFLQAARVPCVCVGGVSSPMHI